MTSRQDDSASPPGVAKTIWTHGCDACNADATVEYVPPLGYLCAFCRRPESLQDLWREHRGAWADEAAARKEKKP